MEAIRRSRAGSDAGQQAVPQALFRSTITSAIGPGARPRAIAFDDTSKDSRQHRDQRVLSAVTKDLGRKIDILGMDACLMSMAEVLYQIRDSVLVTVGSEEVEPSDGWPYDVILKALAAKPEMTPQQLAVLIVEKYLASYAADSNVTQAACDLTKCGELADVLDRLAKALIPAFSVPKSRGAIFESRDQVQEYEVKEYVDLYNFCDLLAASPGSPLGKACQSVMDTPANPALSSAQEYKGTAAALYGVAVHFLRKVISPLYATLDFTGDIGQFLKKYSGSSVVDRAPVPCSAPGEHPGGAGLTRLKVPGRARTVRPASLPSVHVIPGSRIQPARERRPIRKLRHEKGDDGRQDECADAKKEA
jgi:hypothetical protein